MIEVKTDLGKILVKLSEINGKNLWEVSDDVYTRRVYGRDLWPRNLIRDRESDDIRSPIADAVVWPLSKEALRAFVKLASEKEWELYPYGAGSGVCGGVTPTHSQVRPRIVVDLKKLDKIEQIDDFSLVAKIQCGILGQVLEEDLNAKGYTMGHFPSSIYCSSFGGYLATRAAGQLSTYYGKMEDLVLSLEGIFMDGREFKTPLAPKMAVGPDWNQLFIGSEGTLAFLTAASVKIHRLPESRKFLSWIVSNLEEALNGVRQWMQAGLRPAVVRIYDADESRLLHSIKNGVKLVAVVEGDARFSDFTAQRMTEMVSSLESWTDTGTEPAEHWWAHRYDVSYRQQQIMSHRRMILDTFEVSSPWSVLPNLHREIKKVVEQFSGKNGMLVILAHFSHFYHCGGNIYFTLCGRTPEELPTVEFYDQVWDALLAACLKAGGAVSHHHGVGRLKVKANIRQQGALHDILKKLKNELDPKHLLNPENMGL